MFNLNFFVDPLFVVRHVHVVDDLQQSNNYKHYNYHVFSLWWNSCGLLLKLMTFLKWFIDVGMIEKTGRLGSKILNKYNSMVVFDDELVYRFYIQPTWAFYFWLVFGLIVVFMPVLLINLLVLIERYLPQDEYKYDILERFFAHGLICFTIFLPFSKKEHLLKILSFVLFVVCVRYSVLFCADINCYNLFYFELTITKLNFNLLFVTILSIFLVCVIYFSISIKSDIKNYFNLIKEQLKKITESIVKRYAMPFVLCFVLMGSDFYGQPYGTILKFQILYVHVFVLIFMILCFFSFYYVYIKDDFPLVSG